MKLMTRTLQCCGKTFADIWELFAAIIDIHQLTEAYLSPTLTIAHSPLFEAVDVKILTWKQSFVSFQRAPCSDLVAAIFSATTEPRARVISICYSSFWKVKLSLFGIAQLYSHICSNILSFNRCKRLFSVMWYVLNDHWKSIAPTHLEFWVLLQSTGDLWNSYSISNNCFLVRKHCSALC